jgi:hypothetical protein
MPDAAPMVSDRPPPTVSSRHVHHPYHLEQLKAKAMFAFF